MQALTIFNMSAGFTTMVCNICAAVFQSHYKGVFAFALWGETVCLLIFVAIFSSFGSEKSMSEDWQLLYDKTPNDILSIQDRLQCCGFKDVTDRARVSGDVNGTCAKRSHAQCRSCVGRLGEVVFLFLGAGL